MRAGITILPQGPTCASKIKSWIEIVLDRNGEEYVPLMDAVTNLQVEAENVVFIFARHEYYQDPPAEIIDILLSGIGKGYALRDGKIYEVSWRRDTVDGVLYLTLPNGAPYAFKPGNTWFQVLGENSTILQPGEGVWRFEFKMP